MFSLALLLVAIANAQRCSDGYTVKNVTFTGGQYAMNAQGNWYSNTGASLGAALNRDAWSVYFPNMQIDIWQQKIFSLPSRQVIGDITNCFSESSDAVKGGRCSDGYNVRDVSFNGDQWVKFSSGDWFSTKNINMGLETGRDAWSVYFKNYQIDIWTQKVYTLSPTKTEIGSITGCSSKQSSVGGNKCSTGFNANSASFIGGRWSKSATGEWFRGDSSSVGKETGRDVWSVYFSGYRLDMWLGKLFGPGGVELATIMSCSNKP